MATYVGDNTNNLYLGTVDADDISGLGGADTLIGFGGRDLIDGGNGDDQLNGGLDMNADTLLAGAGADTVYAFDRDRADGGGGYDVFVLNFSDDTGRIFDLGALTSGGLFTFGDGTRIEGFEFGSIFFGDGADTISAAGMDVYLYGRGGSDKISGGRRGDLIDGGFALTDDRDLIKGGGGSDTLSGGARDTIDGGNGYDEVTLTLNESDVAHDLDLSSLVEGGTFTFADGGKLVRIEYLGLTLGAGDDRISLGGFDTGYFNAGGGDDTLLGGDGSDVFEGGDGDDLISGGAGRDGAYYYGATGAITVDLGIAGPQDTGAGLDTFLGIEIVVGSGFNDSLTAAAGDNALNGIEGEDTLYGGAGDDTLSGGYAGLTNDQDRITGAGGADRMSGGADADTFVFLRITDSMNATFDIIVDLAAEDIIDLTRIDADAGAAGNQAFFLVGSFTGVAGQAVLTFDGTFTRLLLDNTGDGLVDSTIAMFGDHTGHTNFML